jgi:hypothetical protein
MRPILFCLVPCWLLAAAPSDTGHLARPHRSAVVIADDGKPLPGAGQMERFARKNPVAFLEACLLRYQREVTGYTLTMRKQERLGGTVQRAEVVRVAFREKPFSVFLRWLEGARRAERALYVKGENDGQMLARPKFLPVVVSRPVDGEDARQAGRFPLDEFGLGKGLERTLAGWRDARAEGALHVEYRGEQKVEEAGGRTCYVLRRTGYLRPENDGVTEQTVYIDKETWLQVGSVARGEDGQVIGAYFFRDVRLNPEFEPGQFTREALKR